MGCAASAYTSANQHNMAPIATPASAQRWQQVQIQQQQQQQQQAGGAAPQRPAPGGGGQLQATDMSRQAPVVRSLVSLHRDKCHIEQGSQGSFLSISCVASVSGKATAFFRAEGAASGEEGLEPLEALQVSQVDFEGGSDPQKLRLLLCSGALKKGLEGFAAEGEDKHQLVLDLRADVVDPTAVTVIRTFMKLKLEGEAATCAVHKQQVQRGTLVRSLDALYGALPNPRGLGEVDGGDCVICLSRPREVVILHCRHVCLCSTCANITSSTWFHQCPVCRGRVAAMVSLEGTGQE